MLIKFLSFIKILKNSLLYIFSIFILTSCSSNKKATENNPAFVSEDNDRFNQKIKVQCTKNSQTITYGLGDPPCWKTELKINSRESLKIIFKIVNEFSEDLYERGYQELLRIKDKKIIERMKLRRDDDAYWSEVPLVRIRKQKYLADLDGDGFLEFAIYPFSPGSAVWGTVRIFSLKKKIEFWGEGRYQFEGDTYVQLGCPNCSKFNPEACKTCQ